MTLASRRRFVTTLAALAPLAGSARAAFAPAPQAPRALVFAHLHTGERLAVEYFAGGRYLGRDSLSPSADLKVVRHGKRSITLSYGTCCPAEHTHVRFKLRDGEIEPLQTVPPSYLRAVRR